MKEFFSLLVSTWWGILIIGVLCAAVWIVLSVTLYRMWFKRFYDIVLSFIALVVLAPVLFILTLSGAILMRGNPFFVQKRPGKREKVFPLVKFRTMTNRRDKQGNLLPDAQRLTCYGKFLRASSLDELPELVNIFLGSMSIVGPRPLLIQYLPLYTPEQRRRHEVRPGLTGLAQVSGRNAISWQQKFQKDLEYVSHITLWGDIKIVLKTVLKVFTCDGISQKEHATMEYFTGTREDSSNG